jgi:hypothetical protein
MYLLFSCEGGGGDIGEGGGMVGYLMFFLFFFWGGGVFVLVCFLAFWFVYTCRLFTCIILF